MSSLGETPLNRTKGNGNIILQGLEKFLVNRAKGNGRSFFCVRQSGEIDDIDSFINNASLVWAGFLVETGFDLSTLTDFEKKYVACDFVEVFCD